MRRIKLYIVLLISILFGIRSVAGCQYSVKRIAPQLAMNLGAGYAYGIGETWSHHHSVSVFKNSKPDSFFGSRSWTRKYKGYPEDKRAKFPLSKTSLVFITDGYHACRTTQRILTNTSIVTYRQPEKKSHKLIDFALLTIAFQAGFHLEKLTLE